MPLIEEHTRVVGPLFYRALSIGITPTEGDMDDLDAIEDITFVGYPDGRFDTHNKTPVGRHGTTATPIHWLWQGAKKFLVDASVFPGSSGSPVFIVQRRGYKQGDAFLMDQGRILFVGILSEVYRHGADVEYAVSKRPVSDVREVLDLGVVYRWELVEEAIDAACTRFGIPRPAVGL